MQAPSPFALIRYPVCRDTARTKSLRGGYFCREIVGFRARPCPRAALPGLGAAGAHRVLDAVVDDHVVIAQGQPGAQRDEIAVLQGARALPCGQILLHRSSQGPTHSQGRGLGEGGAGGLRGCSQE